MAVTDVLVEPPDDVAAPEPEPRRRRKRYPLNEMGLAALFLAPSLTVFVAFYYVPFFRLIDWGQYDSPRPGVVNHVGVQQYQEVLVDSLIQREGHFYHGLIHTLLYVVYTVPAGLILGILLAVTAHRRLKGIKVFQAIFSSTLASSVAVSSVLFLYLFNPEVGVWQVNWIEQRGWSLFAAALPSIWANLGLAFVIVLAGLQAVPDEVLEAAHLDGYGPFRRLVKIILPLISPVLLFLTVVLVIFAFQAYAQIEVLTSGGPSGSSETLLYKVFDNRQNSGFAAVLSIGLFGVTLLVTALQFALLERRVHYDN